MANNADEIYTDRKIPQCGDPKRCRDEEEGRRHEYHCEQNKRRYAYRYFYLF